MHDLRANESQAKFIATLVAATFLMGSSFIVGKILLQNGFPPLALVGLRFVIAAAATLPFVALAKDSSASELLLYRLLPAEIATVIAVGLLQTAGVMGLLFLSMQFVSASTAAILLFTNPIWVALLGRLFLNERLNAGQAIGLLLGIVGVALALGPTAIAATDGMAIGGELLGLLSAVCWSVATIVIKRSPVPLGPWALTFWQMLIGGLALQALSVAKGEVWPRQMSASELGCFLWLAIPSSTGSFGLWFIALRYGGATRASGYLFLAPMFAVVLSYVLLGTPLDPLQFAGGLMIGLALWLINH